MIISTGFVNAQTWSFELFGGVPYNVPLPLIIKQNGYDDIRITAKYFSEPFISPYYWVWRFNRQNNGHGWEFEAVHHK
ncbi:MAG: hypothetical protein HY738_12690, partial [Bacteroidia bacterium]|nr:hypothetical protein [Bacteroidia bacterium]